MKTIYAVTGNAGKRESIQKALADLPIKIEMVDPDLHNIMEPQHADVEVVAKSKAMQAWQKIKKPLIVEDSGFHLSAFNQFPGAYAKPVWETLGLDGFVKLMSGVEDRRCHFKGALCYVDSKGQSHTFKGESHGVFATYVADAHPNQWSDAWRIFIPEGFDKTLSQMTDDEFLTYRKSREESQNGHWKKLCTHLLSKAEDV